MGCKNGLLISKGCKEGIRVVKAVCSDYGEQRSREKCSAALLLQQDR